MEKEGKIDSFSRFPYGLTVPSPPRPGHILLRFLCRQPFTQSTVGGDSPRFNRGATPRRCDSHGMAVHAVEMMGCQLGLGPLKLPGRAGKQPLLE